MKHGAPAYYGHLAFGNSPRSASFIAVSDTASHGLLSHVLQKHWPLPEGFLVVALGGDWLSVRPPIGEEVGNKSEQHQQRGNA